MGVGPFAFRYQGTELPPANVLIPLERQLIARARATTLPMTVFI